MLQTRGTATDPELRTVNGFMAGCRLLLRREGARGFFKGIGPRVVTTMPSTAICWSAYEASKAYFIRRNDTLFHHKSQLACRFNVYVRPTSATVSNSTNS
ncbi:putative mitochondrial carrier C8C9.12c like protein [Verticillium longisporum]|nr:putative mitochondrial carrier C8C9.12c like protein [Verticillium longisporum]